MFIPFEDLVVSNSRDNPVDSLSNITIDWAFFFFFLFGATAPSGPGLSYSLVF